MRDFELSEAEVEKQICKVFDCSGLVFWKQPSAGYYDTARKRFRKHVSPYVLTGIPDIIIVDNGRFIGVEVKSRLGKLTEAQTRFQKMIRDQGKALYFVCRNVDDALAVVKAIRA